MGKVLYDSGEIIGGRQGRVIISETPKGIKVDWDPLYDGAYQYVAYYWNYNYPALPSDWYERDNEHHITAAGHWLWQLRQHKPDRRQDRGRK